MPRYSHPIMTQNKGREKLWRKFLAGLRVYNEELLLQGFDPNTDLNEKELRKAKERVSAVMEATQ